MVSGNLIYTLIVTHDKLDKAKAYFQNKISGKDWFSRDMIRALELKWNSLEDEWITLPGPAELWPDVDAPNEAGQYSATSLVSMEWYHDAGFTRRMLKRECWETASYYYFMKFRGAMPPMWEKHISLREEDNWAWRFKGIDTKKFDKFLEEAHAIGDVTVQISRAKIAGQKKRKTQSIGLKADAMVVDTQIADVADISDDET